MDKCAAYLVNMVWRSPIIGPTLGLLPEPLTLESKMSAVAEVPVTPPPASPNWLQRLSALDRSQRMRLGAGIALLVVAAVAAMVMGRQPTTKVLFSNLSDKDGGPSCPVVQMNVPLQASRDGAGQSSSPPRGCTMCDCGSLRGLPRGSVTGLS